MFLKSIKALSYASLFTLFLTLLYLIHSVYIFTNNAAPQVNEVSKSSFGKVNHSFEGLTLFSSNKYFIPSLSIQAFAFTFNMMVAPTIEKLKDPTIKNQYTTFGCVIGISRFTYIVCGILPFWALIPKTISKISFME